MRFVFPPTPCYHRNLEALRKSQPAVAEIVDASPVPEGVTPATGRDGTETFLIPAQNDGRAWFGGSSMPTVSAAEIFAEFHSSGRSVWLPGIFTGVEPLVVASKLPPHAALFVVEQDPGNLKLAMHLHDYVELLTTGRLVFVPVGEEEPVEHLCAFFERHFGYELPNQLLTEPQQTPAQLADLQRLLEDTGRAAAAVHASIVDAQVKSLRTRTFGPLPTVPRVAVLSVDPRPASLEQARRIGRALAKLEWPWQLCVPDAPDKCHVAARLSAVERLPADIVLFVNGTAGALEPLLPPDLPIASWYLTETNVQPVQGERRDGHQIIFASSQSLADALGRAGVPVGIIEQCGLAADDTVFRPATLSPDQRPAPRADVAVLMDLPDDRPQACNITLASHVALWQALREVAKRSADRYHGDLADELVEEAQRESGIGLKEPKIRQHFIALLEARIAPAALARAAVDVLLANGYDVAVWGCNWSPTPPEQHAAACAETPPESQLAACPCSGLIPVGDSLNQLFNAARIVLLPDSSAWAVQTALDALAAGACVICRSPDEPFERQHPMLAGLAPYLHFYRSSTELLDTVRRLTAGGDAQADENDAARTIVLSKHTVAKRLQTILETVRQRAAATAQAGISNL